MPGVLIALLAVLLQMAVGTLLATVLTDLRGAVTRGFLALAAGTALALALLAFGLAGLSRVEGVERLVQGALVASLLAYLVLVAGGGRSPRLKAGAISSALGLAALILAAISRPSAALGPALTLVAFAASALALGAATAGLLLGHWYLVTPRMTSEPLRRLCDLLLYSLIPLTVLAGKFLLLNADASGSAPGGLNGAALWVAGGMITLFPLAVTLAARACCVDGAGRGRSLQAATGLLYLVAAAVLAGGLAGNAVLLGA